MAYYDALIAKWATLSGTRQQKLATISGLTVNGPANPLLIPSYRLFNVIDPAEFGALSAANQQRIRDMLGMGMIDASAGTNARTLLQNIFTQASQPNTRSALVTLANSFESPALPWWQAPVAQGGGGLSSPVSADDLAAAGGLT